MTTSSEYYCVFTGWVPGIYTSMEEVHEQIHHFSSPNWCRFSILDNADAAWILYFGDGNKELGIQWISAGDTPEPVQLDHYRDKQRIALQALHARFSTVDQIPLPDHLNRLHMAPSKPPENRLLRFSMKKVLTKACDKLDIPELIYRIITNITRDGRTCYRHLASLVPPSSHEALVESGRIAFNPDLSIEDAARLTLRSLTEKLDSEVFDYNHDLAKEWEERYVDLAEDYRILLRRLKQGCDDNDLTSE